MASDSSDAVVLVALMVGFFAYQVTEDHKEPITVYYKYCGDSLHSVEACNDDIRLIAVEYMLDTEKNTLTSKALLNERQCSIYDEDNWECVGKYNSVFLRDGQLYEEGESTGIGADGKDSYLPLHRQISWFEYWWRTLAGWSN